MAKVGETKIPITEFLDAYRRQPCLYNSLLDTYKNRMAREEAYEAIIRTLKIPHLTVLDIKLKIKSVRTVYTKELRILMREKEMGRCYEPKLFWFKRADAFLRAVSLSHCKRIKSKDAHVTIKKETSQKILLDDATQLIEDEVEQQQQQPEDHHEDELESDGHMDDVYHTDVDDHGKATADTNSHIIPNARSHTDDLQSICSSTRTPPNKSELTIDDPQLCLMEQQQQQQQPQQQQHSHLQQQQQQQHMLPRKLKYMNYGQSNQQQPQRLATPFPSPSPSHHLELTTNGNPHLNFACADDDLFAFGQSIASQLRSIVDPFARSVAKLRIQQVLFEAETGQSSEAVGTTHLHI